jgi:hypothetical protein
MKRSHLKRLFCKFFTLLLVIFLSFCSDKSVNTEEDETLTISPEGGEYTFADGIKLRVPPGAVDEEKEISLKKVAEDQIESIFEKRGVPIEDLLVCIEGKPDGLVFNHPVEVILSVDLEPGELAIIQEANLNTGSCSMIKTTIKGDPDQDTLVFSVTHFSSFFAEILREIEQFFGGCGEIACRCGDWKMETGDKDYICQNGDCEISQSELFINYPECGTGVEVAIVREITDECSPNLTLSAASTKVPVGEVTSVEAIIKLSCEPLEGQSVDFSASGPGSVSPTYTETPPNGTAYTTFTAGDETGIVTVTARSTVSYYTFIIYASAQGVDEIGHGDHITKELNESIEIEVYEPDQVWYGTIDYEVYTTYTPILEHANYSMEYIIFVSPANAYAEREVNGTADGSQEVTLAIGDECWNYQNLNAPNTLELYINGNVLEDSVNLFLNLEKFDESYFYDYTSCFLCVIDPPPICTSGTGLFSSLPIGNTPLDNIIVPLEEGTYSSSFEYDITSHPYGNSPHIKYAYTITLHRDE